MCKRKSDGRLLLRESAMVQDEDKKAFEDITKCARKPAVLSPGHKPSLRQHIHTFWTRGELTSAFNLKFLCACAQQKLEYAEGHPSLPAT